ncbi:MAG: hemerythrin domain-containing protein [Paludibacter sp.]|nr:hemerythrin domain-containing protein [Paludibacter sp.]
MTPTENLIQEHKIINELLGIMSKIAKKIKSNKVFYANDIEDIMIFLKNFIEKSHHGKEEIFYPLLMVEEIPIESEIISHMLYEHVLTRNYLEDINSCIENCKIGNAFSVELLAETLLNYVVLERNHLNKELNIIYPIANDNLSERKQNEIQKQFERLDEIIEAHRFIDNYYSLLKDLKIKYPD